MEEQAKLTAELEDNRNWIQKHDTGNVITVHEKYYNNGDSDIFSCAHIDDSFDCDYEIHSVEGPHRCNSFKATKGATGCSWKGNSQTGGWVIGTVRVDAIERVRWATELARRRERNQVIEREVALL